MPSTTQFITTIAGVDRTEWVRAPSIRPTGQLGSRGGCTFEVVPPVSQVGQSFTETFIATGLWPPDAGFITAHPIGSAPAVTVNGDPVTVTTIENRGPQGFYWIRNGYGIFTWPQGDPTTSPVTPAWLNADDVIEITYNAGLYSPSAFLADEVIIENLSGTRIFAGRIERTEEFLYSGPERRSIIRCDCTDWGFWLDERYVTLNFAGGTVIDLFDWIVTNCLDGTGITLATTSDPNSPSVDIGQQNFPHRTVTECFNLGAAAAGVAWRLDYSKQLHVFRKTTGYATAPVSLVSDNEQFLAGIRIIRDDSQRATRVGVVTARQVNSRQTDTRIASDGSSGTVIPMGYLAQAGHTIQGPTPPYVTINGSQAAAEDYAFNPGSGSVDVTGAIDGDTIAAKYATDFPLIVWAGDASESRREYVYEARDLPDETSVRQLSTALLESMEVTPTLIEFGTDIDGCQPGMIVPVNDFGLSGNWLIESINADEIGQTIMRYKVRCTDTTYLSPSAVADRLRLKQLLNMEPVKPIVEMSFMLAETIEGITNPGALTGQGTHARRIVPANCILRDIRLSWTDEPSVSDVEIAVYRNGVAIVSGNLTYGTGDSGVKPWFDFAADPYPMYVGDVITLEIISGDATAMDGNLVLTCYKL